MAMAPVLCTVLERNYKIEYACSLVLFDSLASTLNGTFSCCFPFSRQFKVYLLYITLYFDSTFMAYSQQS